MKPKITPSAFSTAIKPAFLSLLLLMVFSSGRILSQAVPELMYFRYDAVSSNQVANQANPATAVSVNGTLNGATVGGVGQFNTALVGNGLTSTSNNFDAGWALNLPAPWTISMWFSGVTNALSSNYLFGGSGGSTFRALTGSGVVAGAGNLEIRGTGMTDVFANGVFDASGTPVVITFVYDNTVPAIKVYINGVFNNQVTQPAALTLTGTNFTIGNYATSTGLPTNGRMDEFRMYNRALSAAEITATWNQPLPIGGGCTGTPTAPVITTATQTAPVCTNGTMALAATNTGAPSGILYQWEQAPASSGPWTTAVGGVGATTLNYTTAALTTTTWYRVKAICGSNTAPSTAYQVLVGSPTPGTITGSTGFCAGGTQVYSIASVFGATSYTWTLPSGWTGTSTTNSITATPNGNAGNVSVTVTSSCGTSPAATLAVTPGTAPAQPGPLNGNTAVCPNISLSYSVPAVTGATSYTWTLPPGWTGTSTANTINVTTGTAGGNITVAAVNNCGTSTVLTQAVTVNTAAPTLGSITGNATVCSSTSQTYSVVSVPNVLTYNWTLPSGWTGSSTSNSITVISGSTSGNVTVTGSTGCSNSNTQSFPVTIAPTVVPAVSISTPATSICNGTPVTFTAAPVNGGSTPTFQWKVNNVAAGTNAITFNTATLANNDIVTLTLTSSAACPVPTAANSNAITMTVIPNAVPGINININTPTDICSGTSVTFSSNITGGGPTPSYQWLKNGSPAGGNAPTYTANNFGNNDTIKCVLTTSALCPSTPTMTSNKIGLRVSPVVTPSVTVTAQPNGFITPGQPVMFTANVTNGGTQPLYQWVRSSLDILGATSSTYVTSNLEHNDKIYVRVVSSADCALPNTVTSNKISIVLTTSGVGTTQVQGADIKLYPNPNNGEFEIAAEFDKVVNSKIQVEIMNTLGQTIYRSEDAAPSKTSWSKKITMDNVANGLYMLRLVADGKANTRRFEINR